MSQTPSDRAPDLLRDLSGRLSGAAVSAEMHRQCLKHLSAELSKDAFSWDETVARAIERDLKQIELLMFRVQQKYQATSEKLLTLADSIAEP